MQPVVVKDIGENVRVGFSGKLLGNTYSKYGADAAENFAKFMGYFPGKTALIMLANGGDTILNIDTATKQELEAIPYDAAITRNPENLLVLNAADCVPLVLYNDKQNFVALAHVGTSGASLHLPSKIVKALGVPPEDLLCYVGPSIGQRSYRFDKDKFEKKLDHTWEDYVTNEPDGVHINLLGYVLDELKRSGVKEDNIHKENVDTGSDVKYFSHRRHKLTGELDGRNCFAVCLNM